MPMTAMTHPTSRSRSTLLLLSVLPPAALAAVLLAAPGAAKGTPRESRPLTDRVRKDASLLAPDNAAPVAFRRIVLVEADGGRVAVEEDGAVWCTAVRTKRLVRSLTSCEMQALGALLARADVRSWQAGDATGAFGRSRLAVLLMSGATRSVALPPPGIEGQRLLALLRALAWNS
jgi:hypothetical protein